MRDGKPAPVRIRTGLSDGTNSELVAGELKEGDLVITAAASGDAAATVQGGRGGSGGESGGRGSGRRGPRPIL